MPPTPSKTDLSVVIPVYNSEDSIKETVECVLRAFGERGRIQVVLINDGSRDGSDRECRALVERHPGLVTYARLSKNFGEHNAVMAGLRRAQGEFVVIMDDDMQNPPEEAMRLFEEARDKGLDLVYSRYERKEHSLFRNLGSWFNGFVADLLLDKPKGLYLSSFKCMSRFLVGEIVRYEGPFPYIDGLALRVTRSIGCIETVHRPRTEGKSGYTLRKLVSLWLNMFVNFSVMPLRVSSAMGLLLVFTALVLALEVIVEKALGIRNPTGFSFLAVAIMMFSGAQLLMLGVMGEYIGKLFLTGNRTPQYVVRDEAGLGSQPEGKTHD